MLTHVTANEEQWDAFVLAHGGGFLQSWGWSQFQEAIGRRAFRVRIDADAVPGTEKGAQAHAGTVAQFTVIELPLPFGQRYAYVPRGPVVRLGDGARQGLESCVEALRERMRHEGLTFSRVEWPWPTDAAPAPAQDIAKWGFRHVGHMQPERTVINDLSKTEADLLAAMHQKTRYNIRVAEKHGVTVREAATDNAQDRERDLNLFLALLGETAERDGFHAHEASYYRVMMDALSPKKGGAMRARLYFAEFEGRAVAAALTGEFGSTATYLHGASSAADRRVMAPYLLHWEIMRRAKAAGFAAYDFWGIAPVDDPSHSWAGITRFKTGFGGADVRYLGAWELPGNRFWYRVYRVAKRLRRG